MNKKKDIAIAFGRSLDKDDFQQTKSILSEDCQYQIGQETLLGPDAICNSYEQNMLEGREKFDKLKWGESWIEEIDQKNYYVHFTDYLVHQNQKYVHRCKQKLTVNDKLLITNIEQISNPKEESALKTFKQNVGLI